MRRRVLLAAVAAIVGLAPVSAMSPIVHADDDSGAGPDENRDEATQTQLPPAPPEIATASDSQVSVLRVGGAIDDFRYDALVLKGRAGDVCAGQIRTGTLRTFYEIVNRFGGQAGTMYSCRERWDAANDPDCIGTVVNPATNPNFMSGCWSNHATGRAFDVMVGGSAASGYNRTRGLAIVNWLLAPDALNSTNSNAWKLGVQQILFDDRCWNSSGDRGITAWADMRECDVGHHDHVHVDMTNPGSLAQTSYWGGTPQVAPKPDTQVLWDRNSFWREAVSWWNLGAESEEGLSLPAGYDRAITGDWDSDGRQDEIFLWDRDTGSWFVQNWAAGDSLNARMGSFTRGYDEIVAGDLDGDGRVDDMLIWNKDNGSWVVRSWSGFESTFRASGTWTVGYDQLVPGDYDGDGRLDDILIWNVDNGAWVIHSWQNFHWAFRRSGTWTLGYDELIVGDWSAGGDLDETLLWDRQSGRWVLHSWSGFSRTFVRSGQWSSAIDAVAPGDYDTDGRTDDLFLYDANRGNWAIYSFHRNVPRNRLTGNWLSGFDVINVGSFSD